MPESELISIRADCATPKLLAIVSVEHDAQVRCGQPNCGHSVYRRIHVVRENNELLVLGSTCFAKRYGADTALGGAKYGGGDGRPLTEVERHLLVNNTEALLAQFEVEATRQQATKAKSISPVIQHKAVPAIHQYFRVSAQKETPWEWVKPWTSVLYLKLKDGSGWIRVQRRDDKHVLVPWPIFDGWDEALPPLFGTAENEYGGYVLPNVVQALQYLHSQAEWETNPGRWSDVMEEVASKSKASGTISALRNGNSINKQG